jgi:hypothetical protein
MITRRNVLQGAAAIAVATARAPYVIAGARSLRVSTFGGYFERMFAQYVYPAFSKATGIAVQSIEQSKRPAAHGRRPGEPDGGTAAVEWPGPHGVRLHHESQRYFCHHAT